MGEFEPTAIRKRPLVHMEIPVRVAPFWYRSLALCVDIIPILTIWALVLFASGMADTSSLVESPWNPFDAFVDRLNQNPLFFIPPILLWLGLVGAVYFIQELLMGQTVGKRLLNLTIVDAHGHRPLAIHVLIRNAVRIVGLLFFGLGYLWAAFDTERRTFHDWVSGTWVVFREQKLPVARNP